jgi:hypothetical protein
MPSIIGSGIFHLSAGVERLAAHTNVFNMANHFSREGPETRHPKGGGKRQHVCVFSGEHGWSFVPQSISLIIEELIDRMGNSL